MKTLEINKQQIDLSWLNILVNHSHSINHISEMAQTALLLGYPMVLWNGRVYSVTVHDSTDYVVNDTDFIVDDIS